MTKLADHGIEMKASKLDIFPHGIRRQYMSDFGFTQADLASRVLAFCNSPEDVILTDKASNVMKYAYEKNISFRDAMYEYFAHRRIGFSACDDATWNTLCEWAHNGFMQTPIHNLSGRQQRPLRFVRISSSIECENELRTYVENIMGELNMKIDDYLYHGCSAEYGASATIKRIRYRVQSSPQPNNDFGPGFYLTKDLNGKCGAITWAIRQAELIGNRIGAVLVFPGMSKDETTIFPGRHLKGTVWKKVILSNIYGRQMEDDELERSIDECHFLSGKVSIKSPFQDKRLSAADGTYQIALIKERLQDEYDKKLALCVFFSIDDAIFESRVLDSANAF